MGCSKQIVHLQEATLKVWPVCTSVYCQEMWASRDQPLPRRSSKRSSRSFPRSPSLVLIAIIMYKLTQIMHMSIY